MTNNKRIVDLLRMTRQITAPKFHIAPENDCVYVFLGVQPIFRGELLHLLHFRSVNQGFMVKYQGKR